MSGRRFRIGDAVATDMGVRERGRVVKPFPWKDCTDGQYRPPGPRERVAWIQWEDGTRGWIHRVFLRLTP